MTRPIDRRELLRGAMGVVLVSCAEATTSLPDGSTPKDGATSLDATNPDASPEDASVPDAGAKDATPADVDPIDATAADAEPSIPHLDPFALREADDFELGVASGDPTPSAIILWTRHTSPQLELRVWPLAADLSAGAEIDIRSIDRQPGGFFAFEVTNLTPSKPYLFAFLSPDHAWRSPLGRFVSPPPNDDLTPVVLGACSCTYNPMVPRTLEHAARRNDLAALLLLGDTTYADGANTRNEYRDKWAQNLSKTGYVEVRKSTPVIATWDDHEVDNNWNPESADPSKVEAAREAFFENLPVRRDPEHPQRIWRKARFGRTVELFVLDSRSERLPSTRETAQAQYLSEHQLSWLMDGLRQSPCVFKLIISSLPIAELPPLWVGSPDDRWEGYQAQRLRLLEFVETIPGTFFVAGDLHVAYTGWASPSGIGSRVLEVLAGPGAQVINPLAATLRPPQFDLVTARDNFLVLTLDPGPRTVRAQYIGDDGGAIGERTYEL